MGPKSLSPPYLRWSEREIYLRNNCSCVYTERHLPQHLPQVFTVNLVTHVSLLRNIRFTQIMTQ